MYLNLPGPFRQGGPAICGRQMESTMTPEKIQQLADLADQLSEALMTAAICADEIRAAAQDELDGSIATGRGRSTGAKLQDTPPQRPLIDNSTFTVRWAGRTCCLRRTVLFRLAARLARQPNQYVTADQLLSDVWEGGVKSPETIRSAVRHLRQRLNCAGMHNLAGAIHATGGCYGLILDGQL